MPAPKGNSFAKDNRGGRPTTYRQHFVELARKACEAGFTDQDLAKLFGVNRSTIHAWKHDHQEFSDALKAVKDLADSRVERSLYQRAIGTSLKTTVETVRPDGVRKTVVTRTRQPPDTTACIFWLKNRRPGQWRDKAASPEASAGLTIIIHDKPKASAR